jgi:hypothetical protein
VESRNIVLFFKKYRQATVSDRPEAEKLSGGYAPLFEAAIVLALEIEFFN